MNDQAETIAFLSDESNYGTSGKVERIDTHASIIFLAGDRAYKLKRAVRYPYLDYSTVELRHRACEAELHLNRRTAPELYLEVRPVRRTADGSLGFARAGAPADWLIVMRRFDQDCLFDRMAEQGRLTPDLLRMMTDEIIRFHAAAEIIDTVRGSSAINAVIEGNRTSMSEVADTLPPDRTNALYERSIDELGQVRALLDRRSGSGHVRRCHGDLHLRNICLLDGHPTLFDCIEFSDAIACIDVLYDFAFLVMDLWHRGLEREANATFNRYLDLTEEQDGLAAVPLFLSLRAAIRAHVEASAARVQTTAASSRSKADLAHTYLSLAEITLQQRPARLIAIGGLSGTGKSTLAQAVAPALAETPGARILRSDVIRKRQHGVVPEQPLPSSAYSMNASIRVYEALCAQAGQTLKAGFTTIADAVFADPAERRAIELMATESRADFTGIWLEAPPELLETRLEQRSGDASDATPDVMRRQLNYETGTLRWHRIPARGSAADTLAAASKVLKLV